MRYGLIGISAVIAIALVGSTSLIRHIPAEKSRVRRRDQRGEHGEGGRCLRRYGVILVRS